MPIVILIMVIQLALVIHVLKTGRDTRWIWALVLVPTLGALAYVIMEIAPDLLSTRSGRNASKQVKHTLNPNKELNEATLEYERAPTVANSTRLGDAYRAKERFQEASDLYRKCLTGMNEFDPDILFQLAQSEFGLKKYAEVKSILDTAIEKNPNYKNQDAHLLYARSLQELGETEKAIEEYEVLISYYTGPEPAYRYALLLKDKGDNAKAQEILQSIIKKVELSPKHYKNLHKDWISLAKKEIE